MVLTKVDIDSKKIVHGAVPLGERPTTYDATVGAIIHEGVRISEPVYLLPPRGIVWVISAETFKVPNDVTGLATLRTTWTHDGVLALNVGVVDPGWDGPLAAALVNFGSEDFPVRAGEPFFRILFHGHSPVQVNPTIRDPATYESMILAKSRKFSRTFLNMDALVSQVTKRVLGWAAWATVLTIVALLVSVLAITLPIGYSVWTDNRLSSAKVDLLERQIAKGHIDSGINQRIERLEQALACFRKEETNPKRTVDCE